MSIKVGNGAAEFARYAFPPNDLGYCGPEGSSVLLDHLSGGRDDADVAARARQFDGAWPYLEAIADASGIADPLDQRVVHAYWVGNELLNAVRPESLLLRLKDRFQGQALGLLQREDIAEGSLAHHSFHVFAVYPWAGLLRTGGAVPLSILEQCRVRWGTVVALGAERADVRSRPLEFDGERLSLGAERIESVRWADSGRSLLSAPAVGDQVSLHWDWICDRLADPHVEQLERCSAKALDLVNSHL